MSEPVDPESDRQHHHKRRSRKSKDGRDSKRISRELVKLLLSEERESKDFHQLLLQTTEQMQLEKQRADDAERKVADALAHMNTLNTARLTALRDATQANKELSLYKSQLDSAQNEINRAQSILSALEAQKHEAESDAARARTTARQLRQEKLITDAREEGRRLGIQEGLERGRQLGYERGQRSGYANGRSNVERPQDDFVDDRIPSPIRPASPNPSVVVPPSVTTPVQRGRTTPSAFHDAPSPRRLSAADIPPDNWIPTADGDSVVRLPPPHSLQSLPVLPVTSDEEPALMVRAPPRTESTSPVPRSSSSTPRQRRSRHRTSSESDSTTISQLDMLNEPTQHVTRTNASSPLSVIQEVLSTHTSPHRTSPSTMDSRGPSRIGSTSNLSERLAPVQNTMTTGSEGSTHGYQDYRQSGTSVLSSSSSSDARLHPQPIDGRRRSTSSTSSSIGIFIHPPSRPHSGTSLNADPASQPFGGFLSPADAHRPVPLPEPSRDIPVIPNVLSMTTSVTSDGSVPIILPSDELPLGFVPMGDFTPVQGTTPLSGSTHPMSPGHGFFAGGASESAGGGRASRGSGRRVQDSDSSSISSSSSDSLTTPPGRKGGFPNASPNTHTSDVPIMQATHSNGVASQPTASRGNARRRGRGRR